MKRFGIWSGIACAAGALVLFGIEHGTPRAEAEVRPAPKKSNVEEKQITELRDQIKKLEGLVPDQAAIMTTVGYHYTNLWFAVQHNDWPLAEFYLGEVRSNVKWAARVKPIHQSSDGNVDLSSRAQSIDSLQFAALKKTIDAKQRDRFSKAYSETLTACYACHKAVGRPYLRPQVPTAPEVQIINMDPNAKSPE